MYEVIEVPVRGGALTVGRWGSGDRTVVAVHGITANHTSWAHTAELLGGDLTVLAPDLRGRGGSAGLPGPWGMATHAEDCVAILDHLGIENAVFAGHSMGGFVVGKVAELYPERVERLVLVDGGVPLEIPWPEGMETDAKLHAVIGPALERLDMDFPDLESYLDYWRPHPAVSEDWNDYTEAYLTYDVHEVDGVWRSKVLKEAIIFDGRETLEDETSVHGALQARIPAVLACTPRGIMNQTPGLYPQAAVKAVIDQHPHITARSVGDVNHYTVAFSKVGAAAVAEILVEAVQG